MKKKEAMDQSNHYQTTIDKTNEYTKKEKIAFENVQKKELREVEDIKDALDKVQSRLREETNSLLRQQDSDLLVRYNSLLDTKRNECSERAFIHAENLKQPQLRIKDAEEKKKIAKKHEKAATKIVEIENQSVEKDG